MNDFRTCGPHLFDNLSFVIRRSSSSERLCVQLRAISHLEAPLVSDLAASVKINFCDEDTIIRAAVERRRVRKEWGKIFLLFLSQNLRPGVREASGEAMYEEP